MTALLFATELYALPILRPLQAAARRRGLACAWVVPDAVARRLEPDETRLASMVQIRRFAPRTVFCAANWVSPALPGDKVQVFHGFNAEKRPAQRGHFRLRGFFDLYCTQGPATTGPFQALAARYRYFAVEETGWPKVDPLFQPPGERCRALRDVAGARPCIMYASTFTPALSAAPAMLETLPRLLARGDRYWLLTLHPKSDPALVQAYRALAATHAANATFVDSEYLLDMLHAADALVCDTSSVVDEMALQIKPVVTINNRVPRPFMLDVATPEAVDAAITTVLQKPDALMQHLRQHADAIHPWRDGRSSERVLDAARRLADGGYEPRARKPCNALRRLQAHKRLRALLPEN